MVITQYFHTVKHLKPGQIINRVSRRLKKLHPYQGQQLRVRSARGHWVCDTGLKPSYNNDKTATFLNESGPLFEWENPAKSKLWLYNLHYFDDLQAEGSAKRRELHEEVISRWMLDNPAPEGTGWEPYPSSLRLVNWIKWLLAGNRPVAGMSDSLTQQVYVLHQQLEYHLLGNHLMANAKALLFAGTFFEGKEAACWLSTGLGLLNEQLKEQILKDGAHFELSPMYHCIVLMDLLDLIHLGQMFPGSQVAMQTETLRVNSMRMVSWLKGMLHPDGQIPFFNDAAFAVTPTSAKILTYASSLGIEPPEVEDTVRHLDASGYIAIRQHDQVALLDVAEVGASYIPGHAHADTLSFEWSLHGQRVLVNSGTSEYGAGRERLRQRQTAAHNTVVVDGQDSSEVWNSFRVARRARPFSVQLEESDDVTHVQASHTGYHRLPAKVTHTREWRIMPGTLRVNDTLLGNFNQARAYFHLHPSIEVTLSGQGIELVLPDGHRCLMSFDGGDALIEESSWHPEFGLSQPNHRIVVDFTGASLAMKLLF